MQTPVLDDRAKVKRLYEFLGEIAGLRSHPVVDIKKQQWSCRLSELPQYESFVVRRSSIFSDEETLDDEPILKVGRPDFYPGPVPSPLLDGWLEKGWDDFRQVPSHLDSQVKRDPETGEPLRRPDVTSADNSLETDVDSEYNSEGDLIYEDFEDSVERVQSFEAWLGVRDKWVAEQKRISAVRDLFVDLYNVYNDLQRDSETLELMAGNGFLRIKPRTDIDHPILLKRVTLKFDSAENVFEVWDTDSPAELYTQLLGLADDINSGQVGSIERDLEASEVHPLDRSEASDFLKTVAHRLSAKSEFSEEPGKAFDSADDYLRIYLEPVLFLRKRIDGTERSVGRIIADIDEGGDIPLFLEQIVSGGDADETDAPTEETLEEQLAEVGGEDPHILLTKPANREQLEIARRIDRYSAVLVQGPPGTGKTHTIANLMGHFLAQGKTVLVTSQKKKALDVLLDKVDPRLQGLCVAVLDGSNADMERSIRDITEHTSKHTSSELKKKADELEKQLSQTMRDLADSRKEIFNLLNRENETIVYAGASISPADAARYVLKHEDELAGIIPGETALMAPFPLGEDELAELYASNGSLSAGDENELDEGVPDIGSLPDPNAIKSDWETVASCKSAITQVCQTRGWSGHQNNGTVSFELPKGRSINVKLKGQEPLNQLRNTVSRLEEPDGWRLQAIVAGKRGGNYRLIWDKLIATITETASTCEALVPVLFGHEVTLPEAHANDELLQQVSEVQNLFAQGKKLGKFTFITHRSLKEDVVREIRVDGHELSSEEDCNIAIAHINELSARASCGLVWNQLMSACGAPEFSELDPIQPETAAEKWIKRIEEALDWHHDGRGQLAKLLASAGFNPNDFLYPQDPMTDAEDIQWEIGTLTTDVPDLIDICKNMLNLETPNRLIQETGQHLEEQRDTRLGRSLYAAWSEQDAEAYRGAYEEAARILALSQLKRRRKDLIDRIYKVAPGWARAIASREGAHGEAVPPDQIRDAWLWKQYDEAISRMNSESLTGLQDKAALLSKKYHEEAAELAEARAWYYLISRTEKDIDIQQALQHWLLAMKRIGKGTGKKAPMWRAKARAYMAQCQSAVPAWVMTMGTALNTLDPAKNRFDVVIVDEASQSDITALSILYYAKKAVIVGDDQQVSPMAIGVEDNKVDSLAKMYLEGNVSGDAIYRADTSLYDIAKTTFRPLMLREHFRCMPDIIGYSNMLSYDFRIRPLRDTSTTSIRPSVVSYRVENGERVGHTNPAEARAIVALMKACAEQPEYDGKTFGVISLLGDEQVREVQSLVAREFEPKELERRKFLCGNAANFQGDERDVIWLTMVDSGNEGGGPLVLRAFGKDEMIRKRYNVATSRAKDQLWVVHSLDRFNDLKDGDIRKGLLDYAANPKQYDGEVERVESQAESPFEDEVGKALIARGYKLHPQWRVGSYRIDFVVEDGDSRIALECDGDRWHTGEEAVRSDLERQTILERLGWRFIRLRGSEYYRNPTQAINRVCESLTEAGIEPCREEDNAGDIEAEASGLKDKVLARAWELLEPERQSSNETKEAVGTSEVDIPASEIVEDTPDVRPNISATAEKAPDAKAEKREPRSRGKLMSDAVIERARSIARAEVADFWQEEIKFDDDLDDAETASVTAPASISYTDNRQTVVRQNVYVTGSKWDGTADNHARLSVGDSVRLIPAHNQRVCVHSAHGGLGFISKKNVSDLDLYRLISYPSELGIVDGEIRATVVKTGKGTVSPRSLIELSWRFDASRRHVVNGLILSSDNTVVVNSDDPGIWSVVPQGVTKILSNAFDGTEVADVELPDSLEEIEDGAFAHTFIQKVDLPASIRRVGPNAFSYGCNDNKPDHRYGPLWCTETVVSEANVFESWDGSLIEKKDGEVRLVSLNYGELPEDAEHPGVVRVKVPDGVTIICTGSMAMPSGADGVILILPESVNTIEEYAASEFRLAMVNIPAQLTDVAHDFWHFVSGSYRSIYNSREHTPLNSIPISKGCEIEIADDNPKYKISGRHVQIIDEEYGGLFAPSNED